MMMMMMIIIIIIFINCNWVVSRWQWLFYMYTEYKIGYTEYFGSRLYFRLQVLNQE